MLSLRVRRVARRLNALAVKILGPATPAPEEIQLPQPACAASVTVGHRSKSGSVDRFFLRRSFPRLLYPFLLLWITAWILLIRQQYYTPSSPTIIGCTSAPWDDWPPDTCGINGTSCQDDLIGLAGETFRCMGGCQHTTLGNERWVGGERVDGEPLIIGGGDVDGTYRADSWVCASAIHAKLISPLMGGCVSINPLPYPAGSSNFVSSSSNGLTSTGFNPSFPGAFTLSRVSPFGCLDLHFIMTGFNAACLLIFTLFLRPPPSLLFCVLLVMGYFHILLFSDPSSTPPSWEDVFAGLIPVLLVGYWIWNQAFKFTLRGFTKLPFDLAFWQGAGYWIGIESSTVLARLPISRLGYDSLDPAGIIALTCIIVIAVIVVAIQAWSFRRAGLVRYYLIRYLPLIPILIILANIPNYTLRLHHYLLALAAIPVLSLPNRVSLFWGAFMLGLWLDGVGRWGWDGILQETTSLLGDANSGSYTPVFWDNVTTSTALGWSPITEELEALNVTAYSLLVNDMQIYDNWTDSSISLNGLIDEGVDNYFRLAYIESGSSMDYTDPVMRWANGSWSGMGDVDS
ncbi:hypothetical protein B9479_001987 [Cryptococcus floricola]|uniref:LCCL domain-containing protein n=1 Tax=Cryptococcus floricola TaxID=2591691 RepID=A0A5D3B382_9TREE|nr:hypothetical protein B9479_001987 [Cryptococcus floricola]